MKVIRISKVRAEADQFPRHRFVCSECPDWHTHDPSMVQYHVSQHGVGQNRASQIKTAFRFAESIEFGIREAVYKA